MLYVIAFVGAAIIALLLWKAMSGDRAGIPRIGSSGGTPAPPRASRPSGPDDDPDFLRTLDEDLRRKRDSDSDGESD
jgi:hypothetical protein